MKAVKLGILAVAIVVGTTGTVSADHRNWTGFSVGIGGGGGALVSDLTVEQGPLVPPGLFSAGFDGIGGEGAFGTVSAGLDYQFGSSWVIGAFVDYDFASIETKFNASVFGTSISAKYELEDVWTIGGRFGFLPNPTTLVYGLVGYSHASISDLQISASTGFTGTVGVPSFDGVTVGAGIETVLAGNVTLKGEYRYTEFDRRSLDLEPLVPGASSFVDLRSEPSLHTGRVSVNYKFNFGSH